MRRRLHAYFFASPSAADTDLDCSPGSHCAALARRRRRRERQLRAPTHEPRRTTRLLQAHARTKATLPALGYEYSALEPVISGTIMELHHSKHHNTYVTNFNAATEKLATAVADDDVTGIVAAQAAIKFNGGGHLNHSIFWQNLAPQSEGGGAPPTGDLSTKSMPTLVRLIR